MGTHLPIKPVEKSSWDNFTLDRAKGWALWKALITCVWDGLESEGALQAMKVIDNLMNDAY